MNEQEWRDQVSGFLGNSHLFSVILTIFHQTATPAGPKKNWRWFLPIATGDALQLRQLWKPPALEKLSDKPMLSLAKCLAIPRLVSSFAMVNLSGLNTLLALAPPPAQPGQPQQPFWVSLVPMLLLIAVFYFALIRPQQTKAKKHAEMLKSVKPGDEVITSGGICGKVLTVKERTVTVRSADAKLEITKSAIAEITERGNGEASTQS